MIPGSRTTWMPYSEIIWKPQWPNVLTKAQRPLFEHRYGHQTHPYSEDNKPVNDRWEPTAKALIEMFPEGWHAIMLWDGHHLSAVKASFEGRVDGRLIKATALGDPPAVAFDNLLLALG